MTTIEYTQLHNPFMKSNPFYRPQKFYSQPKVVVPHELP